jgi:outer membrane protein OmpA-like peptidoglycan-associated protein
MRKIFTLPLLLLFSVAYAQQPVNDSVVEGYDIKEVVIEAKFKKGDRIRLNNIRFQGGTTFLLPESDKDLIRLLHILQKHPTMKIQIQGHICCGEKDIDDLSTNRARTIYFYLAKRGIAWERLSYKGFGSTKPIYPLPEKTQQERIANRRVEIEILEN